MRREGNVSATKKKILTHLHTKMKRIEANEKGEMPTTSGEEQPLLQTLSSQISCILMRAHKFDEHILIKSFFLRICSTKKDRPLVTEKFSKLIN